MKKIAYIINHTTFFSSHILPHAIKAKKKGYDVQLFCGKYSSKSMNMHGLNLIKQNKIKTHIFNFNSSSYNIFIEIFTFIDLIKKIKNYNPDILHIATPKGQIYGGIIARILNIKCLVIFISGMGYLFSNKLTFFEKRIKNLFIFLQHQIFKHKNKILIVENKDDFFYFQKKFKIRNKEIVIINGSGVDLKLFKKNSNYGNNKVVLFVGRILEEKGIYEFIKAAEILKKKYSNWKFIAAGATDYLKPSTISKEFINTKNLSVKFVNYKKNIVTLFNQAAIVCLPSYREGLPKTLCEAAACGIPVVTTDVVGCRSAIIPKKTGELCLPRDINSLVQKIEFLIANPKIRTIYGINGIKLAKKNFNIVKITNKILLLYERLLNEKK